MSGFLGKSDAGVTFEMLEKSRQRDLCKTDDVVRFDEMLSKSDDVVVIYSVFGLIQKVTPALPFAIVGFKCDDVVTFALYGTV